MNKFTILSVLTTVVAIYLITMSPAQDSQLQSEFYDFMAQYGKSYNSESELEFRFEVFKQNMAQAKIYQEQNPLARFGVTIFSDQTEQEMLARMGDMNVDVESTPVEYATETTTPNGDIDWTKYMQPIQNQGSCGSCWAFAATATFEAWSNLKSGDKTKYSEQELVDCVSACSGCNGGLAHLGYDWLSTTSGSFCTSTSYPYQARQGTCKASSCGGKAKDKGHGMAASNEGAILKQLEKGPISISVDAGVWHSYQGGILTSCGQTTNHAVVIAGFKDNGANSYYIVRNSWGPSWGEKGYIYLKYNTNICNITRRPSYPVF